MQVTLNATNGTLTLAGTAGLSFTVGDGTADSTMTFTGTLAAINTAFDGMSFDPTMNFNGAANVQIITDDLGNSGAGEPMSDTGSVVIAVHPCWAVAGGAQCSVRRENLRVCQFSNRSGSANARVATIACESQGLYGRPENPLHGSKSGRFR